MSSYFPWINGINEVNYDDLQCSAHIVLAGLVDPAKEVSRLEKKMAVLVGTADKLDKAAKVGGVYLRDVKIGINTSFLKRMI